MKKALEITKRVQHCVAALLALIKLVEGVQRRATRVLLSQLSYNERLKRLDVLPFVYQREVRDLVAFYKLKWGHYDSFALIRDKGHSQVINID